MGYKKKNIPKKLKDLVWSKYVGDFIGKTKCLCCGCTYIKMNEFHCGHVIAESKGGKTNLKNLRPICAGCNLSMGTKNFYEFQDMWGFKPKNKAPPRIQPIKEVEPEVIEILDDEEPEWFMRMRMLID
jgi:5-methylcytosine-specific restriction endonuclease McrA